MDEMYTELYNIIKTDPKKYSELIRKEFYKEKIKEIKKEKLVFGWFNPILNPNIKKHWTVKVKPKKAQRKEGFYTAKAGVIPSKRDIYRLKVIFYPPDNRKRDLDNCEASLKSLFDGIADAWGVDDSTFRPHSDFGEVRKNGVIEIIYDI
jgi:crossover junction endodeoxyribonuclease RusA